MLTEKITGGSFGPAFGREYTKRAEIVADLNNGADFRYYSPRGGAYCSIRDLADGQFQFRYHHLRKLAVINIKDGVAR